MDISVERFQAYVEMACAPELPDEVRRDLVMQMFYLTRAHLHALMFVRDNSDGTIRQLAADQLDTLHGFMQERLGGDGAQ